MSASLNSLLAPHELKALPQFFSRQRWFGGKSRSIAAISVADYRELTSQAFLTLIDVQYADSGSEVYFVPLARKAAQAAQQFRLAFPNSVVTDADNTILHDGAFDPYICTTLLELIRNNQTLAMQTGIIVGRPGRFLKSLPKEGNALSVRLSSAQQSNSSIILGEQLIMKLFRRPEAGRNPDCEMNEYLAEQSHFRNIPPYAGAIEFQANGREPASLALLQGLVPNDGDGWDWTLEALKHYYDRVATSTPLNGDKVDGAVALTKIGSYLDAAQILGRRTAQMHSALASGRSADFEPEDLHHAQLSALAEQMQAHSAQAFDQLKAVHPKLNGIAAEQASAVLTRERKYKAFFDRLKTTTLHSQRIRIHGDYHLGQVLHVESDFVILDFEGEPTRPLDMRRDKHSPMKDVAGMLRSFSYAGQMSLEQFAVDSPETLVALKKWEQFWETHVAATFLNAYKSSASGSAWLPASSTDFDLLLGAYLIDKALYEMSYEIENRPEWVHIPLAGILSLEV